MRWTCYWTDDVKSKELGDRDRSRMRSALCFVMEPFVTESALVRHAGKAVTSDAPRKVEVGGGPML